MKMKINLNKLFLMICLMSVLCGFFSPTACFALAAGQPGSGLPLQLPLFTGPGRWTICSLILRKAVLQIWNCAHRQCTTDWKCLVHTGIWGHPRQAE